LRPFPCSYCRVTLAATLFETAFFISHRALASRFQRIATFLTFFPSLKSRLIWTLSAWVTSHTGGVCDASDGQSGPTGLMARAESLAGFAVKIFVKEHKVAPIWVVDEARVAAVARAASAGVGEKDAGEARAKFQGDLTKVHHVPRSGGTFDLEAVSIEMVVAFEGLEDEEVYREPDRPTPVRVAAEQTSRGFAGVIVDPVLDSTNVDDIRIILVKLRNGA